MHGDARGAFSQFYIRITEPMIFSRRWLTLTVVGLLTTLMAWQAAHIVPDAGFEKQLPLGHEYIKVFKQYQKDFGGANLVLFAAIQKPGKGDIYNPQFMGTLRKLTDEIFFLPGVDRSRVSSLFTPDVRFIEVVEGGFAGGNVVPAEYQPTPEMLARVRGNVGKAGIIGRLVTNKQDGAMVFSELLDSDPITGEKLDYAKVASGLEEIRNHFTSPVMYEYKTRVDQEGFKAGDVVARRYIDHRSHFFTRPITVPVTQPDYTVKNVTFQGGDLDINEAPNPDYNPDIDVHIIGFAKVVGDVTDATLEVVSFFGLTLLIVLLLLWQYTGSLRVALLPLSCAVLAVIWELGLLKTFGYGLDPFAILVPFLILSIGVSHGIQITSFWLYEVSDHGHAPFEASRATYRRLVIPGITALLTNVVGFGTILLVPIQIIQEMAINACFGLVAIVICKKILLPCLLTYASVPNLDKFRAHQRRRDKLFEPLWHGLSLITLRPVAGATLAAAVAVWAWAMYVGKDLKTGELHPGVPELRPDSRYNKDTAAIVANFAIGVDEIKIIAETHENACIDSNVMQEIDRYAWHMTNLDVVSSVLSLPQVAKIANSQYNEASPKWKILSRNKDVMVMTVTPFPTSTGFLNKDCSAMPVRIFTADHKAESIDKIVAATNEYNASLPANAQVKFRLATGNVGVMAAQNDVIKETDHPILYWVYGAIFFFVWMSFRSIAGVVCVLVPLALVSVISYAVMVLLQIGVKVSTLPVAAFAAGIGVDYGIYIFSVLEECVNKGMPLRQAYEQTLHQTGKAVVFTSLSLAGSVCTWMLSDLQFQIDMGILLTIMFVANAVAAVLLLPAFASFLLKRPKPEAAGAEPTPASS
jgi:predicted RND superfamily exporter protein